MDVALAPIIDFLRAQANKLAGDIMEVFGEFNETGTVNEASILKALEPLFLISLGISVAFLVLMTLVTGISFVGVGVLVGILLGLALPHIVNSIVGLFQDQPVGEILAGAASGSRFPALFAAMAIVNETLIPPSPSGDGPSPSQGDLASGLASVEAFVLAVDSAILTIYGARVGALSRHDIGAIVLTFTALVFASIGLFVTDAFVNFVMAFIGIIMAIAGLVIGKVFPSPDANYDKAALAMNVIGVVASVSFTLFWGLRWSELI